MSEFPKDNNSSEKTVLSQPICEEFERAWRNGGKPRIEDYLSKHQSENSQGLFRELLECELKLKVDFQEEFNFQDYVVRFPSDTILIKELFELVGPASDISLTHTHHPIDSDTHEREQFRLVPEKLNHYDIQSELGVGSFGKVYLAYDTRLDRLVAIKMLHPDRDHFEKMLAEARAQANIDHPHVLPIYSVDEYSVGKVKHSVDEHCVDKTKQSGSFYIVSKYAAKGTLGDRLKSGPAISIREAVDIVIAIAKALDVCHRKGIVHRDVKPNNILFGEKRQIYLADFGLVLAQSEQHSHRNRVAGSPAYMSPEQTKGRAHHLDGRADIWALGVVFYEILSGVRPFQGDSADDLYEEIQEREPNPVRINSDEIPAELEQIVMKCLQKDVGNRYALASDLVDDLESWKGLQSTIDLSLSDTHSITHEAAWPSQKNALLLLGIVCVLGLLSFIGWQVSNNASRDQNLTPLTNVIPLQTVADLGNGGEMLAMIPTDAQGKNQTGKPAQPGLLIGELEKVTLLEGIWNIDPNVNGVKMYSQSRYLLPLGKLDENQKVTFQITFNRPKFHQIAGICFALRPERSSWKRYAFQGVSFSTSNKGKLLVQITGERNDHGAPSSYGIFRQEIETDLQEITLKVTLSDKGLEDVSVKGLELNEPMKHYLENRPTHFGNAGQFGLWTQSCETIFSNPVLNGTNLRFVKQSQ